MGESRDPWPTPTLGELDRADSEHLRKALVTLKQRVQEIGADVFTGQCSREYLYYTLQEAWKDAGGHDWPKGVR